MVSAATSERKEVRGVGEDVVPSRVSVYCRSQGRRCVPTNVMVNSSMSSVMDVLREAAVSVGTKNGEG